MYQGEEAHYHALHTPYPSQEGNKLLPSSKKIRFGRRVEKVALKKGKYDSYTQKKELGKCIERGETQMQLKNR